MIDSNQKLMTADYVIRLYAALENLGVKVWIDGGWGVDALLEKQTRPHEDVDIVVQEEDLPKLREFLEGKGYKDVEREDTTAWNFVLGDDQGHLIDIHVIVLDKEGNGIYGPAGKGDVYPADALKGAGSINGHRVRCISAEWMVKFHAGYKLRPTDYQDIAALCEKFGIDLPEVHEGFKNN